MARLVVVYSGALHQPRPGWWVIDEKLRSGVASYGRLWPGGDVVLATPVDPTRPRPAAGLRTVAQEDLGFDVVSGSSMANAADRAAGDLHLIPLISRASEVSHLIPSGVLVAEFSPEDLAEPLMLRHPVRSLRGAIGDRLRRRRFEAWVRDARGLQANGYAAHERFHDLSRSPLLFFDTRLTDHHLDAARQLDRDAPHDLPVLCFSGRMIPGKGPQYAIEVARRLADSGIRVELLMLGAGPMEAELRAMAPDNVRWLGTLDFATDWTALVRDQVDVMLLPHTQGDPSGTYLEAAGCGVPLAGFDNVALAALVSEAGLGTVAPIGDVDALVTAVTHLLTDHVAWRAARNRCLTFMTEHTAEREFQRRIDHLVSLL